MEEDSSAKAAPATRLRRRLSVEPEDSPLPTTPSTPSKKRSTRLAAKPQLELINEVASENVPKRTTRKTAIKEVESEGIGTPTPVTPSRRSTRIRSNTSLLSETISQSVESPRAKRALRRNSQLGSDNESAAPITPARQTRRTRKDSATSVDKQAAGPDDNIVVLTITSTETITKEETPKDPKTNKGKADSPSTRKSPRLNKNIVNTDETDNIHVENAVHSTQDKNSVEQVTPVKGNQTETENNKSIHSANPKENKTEIEILSTSTSHNKSTTSMDKSITDPKSKRNRTKSWTTLTASPLNIGVAEGKEGSTEKLIASYINISGSGDGIQNAGNNDSKLEEPEIKAPSKSINKSKSSLLNTSTENKENIVVAEKPSKTDIMNLFETSPINQKPIVLIEDSDSGSYDKLVMDIQIDGEDQCVPVGKPINQTRKDSLEPMDIDETMPENVTIDDFSDKSNASIDEIEVPEKRKSLISEKSLMDDKSLIKSERKSSLSKQASDTPPENPIREDDKNKSTSKQLLNNTLNSTENAIDSNKSRKKSVSFREEKTENVNESKRKSSVSQSDLDKSQNESVKLTVKSPKSSKSLEDEQAKILNVNDSNTNQNKDESSKSLNKSTRKSLSSSILADKVENPDESINKSKKNVSISQNYSEIDQAGKTLNKSQRKSSTSIVDDNLEKLYESCNNEIKHTEEANNQSVNKTRKSSTSIVDDNLEKLYESCNNVSSYQNKSEMNVTEEANNNSQRNNSVLLPKENNSDNLNETSETSRRKSSNSKRNSSVEDNKSVNKLKRSSSQSQTESPRLEKSGNENKSTLVISQIKDVSINDSNNVTSSNLNNLSKSESGPEVKNKALDKINLSPKNYLTSTPIQQKSLQKMAIQINTSIISPAMENKNETIGKSPKLNGIEEEIKIINKKKISRAPSSSESSDEEINIKNKKKLSRAQSSSSSSNEETKPKTLTKLGIKNQPALDSSESETETESPRNNSNKKNSKKVQALDSSSEEGSDLKDNQQKKTNNESKVKAKKVKKSNNKAPVSNNSNSEDSEEEVSKDRSKMFDDEASEASSDYESGDSRSDEERQYEDENEILEKGETLESEAELSNDSDYERDSFIVSSDAEDNEMLSGTGDDLSMSDNELTMSAKSKKKFNERKLKQQKEASREMYEARHKNDSAASLKSNTSKSKKSKRQRLESSTLESENDSKQTKKTNRLRIDSSQDGVNCDDESIIIKKKKSKRLSESVCETTMNEKEISLFNQTTEKNDPLIDAIKLEPKTPLKDLNISTVAINDNIEEVQVDSNASIMKHSDTLDPLQATMAVDDEDEEDSMSENNEIIENYDSVLNNLSLQTKKFKTHHDTSLNLNKKTKITKNPVIDQLNLTQTKKSDKKEERNDKHKEPVKSKVKENVTEEDSSDCIDMKLLFPEDSNDSEANASKFKPEENKLIEPDEQIIPLKRTEAKTNLLDNTDMNISSNESSLNSSKKKNKKRTTSQSNQPGIDESMTLDNGIKIIVDTTGTHEEVDLSQAPTNSSKKKNKKNKSLNETAAFELSADIDCTDGFTVTQVETSIRSDKKKKKNKNKEFDQSMKSETSINLSGSHGDKKSRKLSQSTSDFIETAENQEEAIMEEMPVNTSIKSEKKKKNKNASLISEPVEETQSAKKKSKKISISDENKSEETMIDEIPLNTSIKSEKKKKKNKDASVISEPVEETQSAKKKSKKISISEEKLSAVPDESDDAPEEVSYKTGKESMVSENVTDDAVTNSTEKKFKKNKKKRNKNKKQSEEELDVVNAPTDVGDSELRKRKRKVSNNPTEPDDDTNVISTESVPSTLNQKKKLKVNQDVDYAAAYNNDYQSNEDDTRTKKSKKNKSKIHVAEDIPQNNAKKRKNREDDDSDEKISKVSKQDSLDEIHVPRLPETILKQLSGKPTKKLTAISTMPFTVEEGGRKNKPSEYLEQSVYLNNSPVKKKKPTKKMNPKVLPFTPTALTSDSGFTSRFNISLLPKDTKFVAQASNAENFKEAFLGTQRIKKMGTLERCKIQRSHKLSKF